MAEPIIIARTDRWLVINKPAGWLTIRPSQASSVPVLFDWVRQNAPEARICHRLDVETSGTVLFALGIENQRLASGWFSSHEVKKTYFSLCQGAPRLPVFKISTQVGGNSATTQVTARERFKGAFLAEARPVTGRRHQIRVHLSSCGHPILGDTAYGGPASWPLAAGELAIPRVALHAAVLELPSGEKFTSELPDDFRCWVEALRANQSA